MKPTLTDRTIQRELIMLMQKGLIKSDDKVKNNYMGQLLIKYNKADFFKNSLHTYVYFSFVFN